jgi:hypothetical protein
VPISKSWATGDARRSQHTSKWHGRYDQPPTKKDLVDLTGIMPAGDEPTMSGRALLTGIVPVRRAGGESLRV